MSDPATRARLHFPTIQITMVSIIVALALQQWRLPATAEAVLAIIALLVAALHHTIHLGETSLLAATAVYLAMQGLSSVGPMLTWRMLRNAHKQ